ncbi:hypothetical protein KR52_01325 [Synechococcus sp. KORDI-52]|uniref:hypothetical protein n=1 Tax=Synechococcus sp. KORDI-52 TaxID=585425 RepID=UPI0004E05D27|nr:hypothetical protein [Synechococcus sp. KORDI-52]AII47805.1 hypothetical protein KR52_01325 [Synechococcus sp. KORDI-52]
MLLRSFFRSGLFLFAGPSVLAGPLVCTTSVEAPPPGSGSASVEVTVCQPTETTSELINRRLFTWTSPMARGVDPLHQLTDLLGIAVGGIEGNRLMGLGFPDQTLVWDGSALQNTAGALLEAQSPPMPLRTMDIPSGFDGSVVAIDAYEPMLDPPVSNDFPDVTPLW